MTSSIYVRGLALDWTDQKVIIVHANSDTPFEIVAGMEPGEHALTPTEALWLSQMLAAMAKRAQLEGPIPDVVAYRRPKKNKPH